jgi:hypothetical protein
MTDFGCSKCARLLTSLADYKSLGLATLFQDLLHSVEFADAVVFGDAAQVGVAV